MLPGPPRNCAKAYQEVEGFNKELQAAGAWVFAGGLHPASAATVMQVRDGEVLITDGPFAEGKEHIGGFWVIQAPDLDGALAWATGATKACAEVVEVRPKRNLRADSGVDALRDCAIDRVFREEYCRAVAVLVRVFGDIDIAASPAVTRPWPAASRWR
ncbi:MAG: hypothetical protein NVSMB32_15660 [Actinomycetota bacterium]